LIWTVVAALTAPAPTEKLAVVAPAGTVTAAGTVRLELLLLSVMATPLTGAAAVKVTVQVLEPEVVREAGLHARPLSTGPEV
jgi:hypothetical protein